MPLFHFRCQDCFHEEEVLLSGTDRFSASCPACRSNGWKRSFPKRVGVHFKGKGFYVTDSRKGGRAKKVDSKPVKKETKSKGKGSD
ncbi:hypothetical protein H8D30_06100 [bacterium]|nr:hypothetical protein [bacterium]